VRRLITELDAIPPPAPSRVGRVARGVRDRYWRLIEMSWFRSAIVWLFALWALASAVTIVELVFSVGLRLGGARAGFGSDAFGDLTFINIASLCSTVVSAVLIVLRLRDWRQVNRLRAYQHFDRLSWCRSS
jgi:hypothetical protein